MVDSLFADVSEYQVPVDDSYPYQIFSLRSNDGTYRDHNFFQNYAWSAAAADSGRLACFIVYFYWRPNWLDTINTHRAMIADAGGPHPKMISMVDVESGSGNPSGDQSDGINRAYWGMADWLGSTLRVIGYANRHDFFTMWPVRPEGLRVIGAGYGRNPNLPGQIAHQYTDGSGWGGGLPEGAPPFGNCDMNAANGYTPEAFAADCGVGAAALDPLADMWIQFMGPGGQGWPQLGNHTLVDAVAAIGQALDIPGFHPGPRPTRTPLPRDAAARIRAEWTQLLGTHGTGLPQLGNRSLVDAIAAIGRKLDIDCFRPDDERS
ncbi:hypothetical protein NDR87_12020 [Nocardia sp. CDC159]|uniref:Uncharacterized protein n=1 Tax=Nocardia pulmonis TaxID=2951408 RepID=A0A9X2E5J1_9NOCA|nr:MULTISPECIES: hypothetical protein [Nocardia]MCM6774199.1 hypothetical protein [Nocardia pulmonis]MCM6787086.1 hypothetical protein [Nocardia sp. CDC159]